MKNALLLIGGGLAAYGVYRLMTSKPKTSGVSSSAPTLVKRSKQEIYPDVAEQKYDTSWSALFPTPRRLGVGPLLLDNTDTFTGSNLVQS